MKNIAANIALGIVGSFILTAYIFGFVAKNIREEIAKKGRSV